MWFSIPAPFMALDPQSVFLGETVTKQILLLQSREAIQLLSMLTESTGNNKLPLHNTTIFPWYGRYIYLAHGKSENSYHNSTRALSQLIKILNLKQHFFLKKCWDMQGWSLGRGKTWCFGSFKDKDFVQTGWNRLEGSRLSLVWVDSGQRCLPNGGKEGWKWWLQPRSSNLKK